MAQENDTARPVGRFIWINEPEFQDWSYAVDAYATTGGRIEQVCDPLLERYRNALVYPAEAIAHMLCPADKWDDDQARSEARMEAQRICDLLSSEA